MMKRDDCFEALKRHITNEIVVATYTSAHDWVAIAPRELNYFSTGAMGLASSHALGIALGAPQRRVVVLDGEEWGTGVGRSKKQAEQAAAREAWVRLDREGGVAPAREEASDG